MSFCVFFPLLLEQISISTLVGGGAYPQARLSEARWSHLALAPHQPLLLAPAIPSPDPPSGSNVAASLLLFGHFFLRAVAIRGTKLEVRQPQGQLSAVARQQNSGWSVVGATPTLRTKLTLGGARKVRKKLGMFTGGKNCQVAQNQESSLLNLEPGLKRTRCEHILPFLLFSN